MNENRVDLFKARLITDNTYNTLPLYFFWIRYGDIGIC